MHPWVQIFYPVLGLGSGERLPWHFQTPVLSVCELIRPSLRLTSRLLGGPPDSFSLSLSLCPMQAPELQVHKTTLTLLNCFGISWNHRQFQTPIPSPSPQSLASLFRGGPLCLRMAPGLPAWVFEHTASSGGVCGRLCYHVECDQHTHLRHGSPTNPHQSSPKEGGGRIEPQRHIAFSSHGTRTIVPTPGGKESLAKNGHSPPKLQMKQCHWQ